MHRIERRGVMIEDPGDSNDSVVDAVVRASRALVGITLRALSSVSDEVTLPQLRTLVVVSLQGPQTVSALAERLDVHASTMTRMCNRLVARGLVVRKPSAIDRREVVIELTPPGQGLVDEVLDKRRHEINSVVQRMSADDRERVVSALELFSQAANSPAGADDPAQLLSMSMPSVPQLNA
jgi:DNA-binding MarR family transcriptional regulator